MSGDQISVNDRQLIVGQVRHFGIYFFRQYSGYWGRCSTGHL